jgi:hypothetical protein
MIDAQNLKEMPSVGKQLHMPTTSGFYGLDQNMQQGIYVDIYISVTITKHKYVFKRITGGNNNRP